MTIKTMPLGSLKRHADLQLRVNDTDAATVALYARMLTSGSEPPPVRVAHIGKNHYIIDGYHRVEAARKEGRAYITADVRRMSMSEAVKAAWSANTGHGKNLNNADRNALFLSYIAQERHLEDDGFGQLRVRKDADIARDLPFYPRQTVWRKLRENGITTQDADDRKPWRRGETHNDEEDMDAPESEAEAMSAIRTALDTIVMSYGNIEARSAREEAEGMIWGALVVIAPPSLDGDLDI